MKPVYISTLLLAALLVIAGAGLALAQTAVDPIALPQAGASQRLTAEQRELLRQRFMERRGRMELRHRGFALVDGAFDLTDDPAKAAILQIHRIDRIYREQQDQDGLRVFYEGLLSDTDNTAIRNVAWMRLSDLHTEAKDADGAMELLKQALDENLRQIR